MRCMDIWGGNRDIDTSVTTQGLDAWLLCRPFSRGAGEGRAGGDIHYLTSCATGRITRMLLADVSGHGEAVAEAARSLRLLLGRYANYIDQTRFVEAVNRRFGDIAGEGGAGLFATAVVATYFSPTDELTVCSAGHPPALHYRAAQGAWRAVRDDRRDDGPSNLPLGVLDDTEYRQTTVVLEPHDLVLLYTDAITEAATPGGVQLGVDGLLGLAGSIRAPADRFIPELLEGVARHRGGASPAALDDDVSLLLVRRNGLKPRPSVGLGLIAGWRIARTVLGSLVGAARPALPEISVRAIGGAFLRGLNRRSA